MFRKVGWWKVTFWERGNEEAILISPLFSVATYTFFRDTMDGQGWPRFLNKSNQDYYIRDNTLTIECEIEVLSAKFLVAPYPELYTNYTWAINEFSQVLDSGRSGLYSPVFYLDDSAMEMGLRMRLIFEQGKI